MKHGLMKQGLAMAFGAVLCVVMTGCAPEVGSEAWCKQLQEKPKGDWSANELADFTKHCVFK